MFKQFIFMFLKYVIIVWEQGCEFIAFFLFKFEMLVTIEQEILCIGREREREPIIVSNSTLIITKNL